jgi:hypothetical protein
MENGLDRYYNLLCQKGIIWKMKISVLKYLRKYDSAIINGKWE